MASGQLVAVQTCQLAVTWNAVSEYQTKCWVSIKPSPAAVLNSNLFKSLTPSYKFVTSCLVQCLQTQLSIHILKSTM